MFLKINDKTNILDLDFVVVDPPSSPACKHGAQDIQKSLMDTTLQLSAFIHVFIRKPADVNKHF